MTQTRWFDYDETTGTLTEHSRATFMGDYYYRTCGCLGYTGAEPVEQLGVVDGVITVVRELPVIPVIREFSRLLLRDNLVSIGLWDTTKAAIESSSAIEERFDLANVIKEDDPDFILLREQLKPQMEGKEVTLEELLNACVAK